MLYDIKSAGYTEYFDREYLENGKSQRYNVKGGITLGRRKLSKNVQHGTVAPQESPIRKICIFPRRQIYRTDGRENLHDGIYGETFSRTLVFPLDLLGELTALPTPSSCEGKRWKEEGEGKREDVRSWEEREKGKDPHPFYKNPGSATGLGCISSKTAERIWLQFCAGMEVCSGHCGGDRWRRPRCELTCATRCW